MKLSISMIVKNEEKNLERTLVALTKLNHYISTEIVIVDTGSEDETINIAKRYTDKVYFYKWNDNFASMRNISINYCSGDWILVVDADEVLYDIKKLANLIKNKSFNKYNAGLIKIINFKENQENSIKNGTVGSLLRLFKKGTVKYEGIVHEQPKFSYPVEDTNIRFIHYGYDNNDYQLMEYKFKRNLELLLKQLKEDPNNIYINFQVATSYSMHKDYIEALKYIDVAYEKAKNEMERYVYVIDKYCFILYNIEEYSKLLKKVKEAISYCSDFIDFYFYAGQASYNLNYYDKAIKYYEKYLYYYSKLENNSKVSNNTLSINTREFKDQMLYNLAICYYKKLSYKKSLDIIFKIENKNILKNKVCIIFKIINEGKLWDKVYILNNFIDQYSYDDILSYVHNDILLEDLMNINKEKLEGNLKEIISTVKYLKENETLEEKVIDSMKKIIDKNKKLYSIYLYYILKYDVNEIKKLICYGKEEVENILTKLCLQYFDFNSVLIKSLNKIKFNEFSDVVTRTVIEKSLLLSGKLPDDKKKKIFLDYISEKYYIVVKLYNSFICQRLWMLSSEERFVIKLKEVLSYKYIDTLEYVKSIKAILNMEKSYVDYIKILVEEKEKLENNSEVKAFIPELIKNIQILMDKEKYQEAYNTIEEGLSLVKFDLDLLILKYQLLVSFNYEEESIECLKQIILYGENKKVNKIINDL